MAEKKVETLEAKRHLDRILREVSKNGDRYVVQADGAPVAVVVPVAMYERWKRDRGAFFEELEGIARRSGLDPDSADHLSTEAVSAVRDRGRNV